MGEIVTETATEQANFQAAGVRRVWDRKSVYEEWVHSLGLPTYSGYFIDDIRKLELGWWEERKCNAAILLLAGQEGISEVRVSEIPAGGSTAPMRMALDELVYVADGRGLTTITSDSGAAKTFEWQKHSLFMLPRHHEYQLSSTQGDQPARLLHYNSLPLATSLLPDPEFFFSAHFTSDNRLSDADGTDFYSEAKVVPSERNGGRSMFWVGNFFPDMRAWDRITPFRERGAGGHVVWIQYPGSPLWNHMSVFPSQTYKKAHRHGPGTLIVIPSGEGFSYMWPEGKEKVFVPWHEGSVFVPPNRWFHQHFNLGGEAARYLAFHSPRGASGNTERVEDVQRDQIEYPDEDPIVRETFERELEKRGLHSLMVDEAYRDRNYQWGYEEDAD
ncbi:MAG: hypothetical protein QOF51_2122 [Chloroflexota bacterium]|jgi:hypothetical protein|nr:hypothetical protein [Chloroflexota bacterium]